MMVAFVVWYAKCLEKMWKFPYVNVVSLANLNYIIKLADQETSSLKPDPYDLIIANFVFLYRNLN